MDDKANYYPTPIFQSFDSSKYATNAYTPNNQQPEKETHVIDDKTLNCVHCNLTFDDGIEYEHHNVELHGKRKILSCESCSATFRRQDHLKRHIRSIHQNQKYCLCPVCKKDCKRQDILLKHIKRKHTSTSEVFNCRVCDFKSNTLKLLEEHEISHFLTERHVCPHCDTTFKRRDHMLRHVKSQHLNQYVLCPLCGQTYKRKDHVVRHVREKHKMGLLNGKLVTASDMLT